MGTASSKAFCTICNLGYLAYVRVLGHSLQQIDSTLELHVLVVDAETNQLPASKGNIIYYDLAELQEVPHAERVIKKYRKQEDILRWALKPVWMMCLIERGIERLCYADGDLYFFDSIGFIWDILEEKSILLCPHWRIMEPDVSEDWFIVNFTDGIYNAGFVGANANGKAALEWWAMACAYKCEKDHVHGLHDDQKYLDLIPAVFDKVGILQHRGCNVAFWNRHENTRVNRDGKVLIRNQWPIVFIHFTKELSRTIENGQDKALLPYLEKYHTTLGLYN